MPSGHGKSLIATPFERLTVTPDLKCPQNLIRSRKQNIFKKNYKDYRLDQNRRRMGLSRLRSGTRFQELELETLAKSRACVL
jgi:hypothetical protein